MKRLALATVVLLFIAVVESNAQTSKRLSATPKAFQVFYSKFRKAVRARDRATVASMTRFPFKYGYDAGDEGTYSRTEFLRNFNKIFESNRPLFASANPTFYGDTDGFDLMDQSDASHFVFEKRGATYKFTAFIVEP